MLADCRGFVFDLDGCVWQGDVLNPGALAHTSYAVRDAVEASGIPVVEVHLSNVHARERWRHHLAVAPAAAAVIAGMGPASYDLGLRAAADLVARRA